MIVAVADATRAAGTTVRESRADAELPAASVLLGDRAAEPLDAALASAGASLLGARRGQVLYRPGRRISAEFTARVALPDGSVQSSLLVAAAGIGGPPQGSLVVEQGDARIGVWRYPHDPRLPGLAAAVQRSRLRDLLDELGIAGGEPRASLVTYRPGRRAVVLVTVGGTSAHLKVLRPSRAAALAATCRRLARAGAPVPGVLGVSERLGVVALESLPGRTVRSSLNQPGASLPDPDAVLSALGRLDVGSLPGPLREGAVREAGAHGRLLATVAPSLGSRVEGLVEGLGQDLPEDGGIVHGDLHDGQLVAHGGRISGLIDLDGVGRGRRSDDLATLLAHLCVTALGTSVASRRALPYARRMAARFAQVEDPAELRRRTAAVVLGLATGPFRTQRPGWERETAALVTLAEGLLAG